MTPTYYMVVSIFFSTILPYLSLPLRYFPSELSLRSVRPCVFVAYCIAYSGNIGIMQNKIETPAIIGIIEDLYRDYRVELPIPVTASQESRLRAGKLR